MKYYSIKKDILASLAYFDLFHYPLKKNELFFFLGHCDDYREFDQALNGLLVEGALFRIGEFYSLEKDPKLAENRRTGNEKAFRMLKKARIVGKIISVFPYVKGVAVSGSLSKYWADEHSDIDFFIITSANRLWIARTFLHLLKKVTFLFNLQDYFCMNYFIDEMELEIREKNIYTAIEIATLMPMQGLESMQKFFQVNHWTRNFLPNHFHQPLPPKEFKRNWIRLLIEKIMNKPVGNKLDDYFMNLTASRWQYKKDTNRKNSKGLLMSLHTDKHFAKPDPEIFQQKILQRYNESLYLIFHLYEYTTVKTRASTSFFE